VDWKRYYREELESEARRRLLEKIFRESGERDPELTGALAAGGIVSIPHTALPYSGPLIMRVVRSLLRLPGLKRILALGVLHMGALPEPFSELYRRVQDPEVPKAARKEAFAALARGFVPALDAVSTPLGEVPIAPAELPPSLKRDSGILAHEFSLDTFLVLWRYTAEKLGNDPPPVLPVYVGLTHDPVTGSFSTAAELARVLSPLLGLGTAAVATGDVVHYGLPYGDDPGSALLPMDPAGLETYFRGEVERTLALALEERDYAAAFERSEIILKSDQRHLLPVIAELLGPGAGFRILEFSLSDYAPIFGVAPPCLVASSLFAFLPASSLDRSGS